MKVRKFQIAFTVASAMAFTVAIVSVSQPQPVHAQNLQGMIMNQLTHLYLQPANGSRVAGAAIVQEPSVNSGDPAQLWTVVPVQSPYVHYVNQLSGMCLDAAGGAQNHTPVQQWPCNSGSNQNWVYSPVSSVNKSPVFVYSGIWNSYPKFCLDVPGGQATSGLALQIYLCNGTGAQQWD